jgi:hypothetical protein
MQGLLPYTAYIHGSLLMSRIRVLGNTNSESQSDRYLGMP